MAQIDIEALFSPLNAPPKGDVMPLQKDTEAGEGRAEGYRAKPL